MGNADAIITMLRGNHYVVTTKTNGITHAMSVAQSPLGNNNFNWVLGHIVHHRDFVLKWLGEEPLLAENERTLYDYGSHPVPNYLEAVRFESLVATFEESQAILVSRLCSIRAETLAREIEGRNQSLFDAINGMVWHETYHVGQLELLRDVALQFQSQPQPVGILAF